jgi:hypothetical protein
MHETDELDRDAMSPTRLAFLSIALTIGATAALVATNRTLPEADPYLRQSLTLSPWFEVTAMLAGGAVVTAAAALRAGGRDGVTGSWPALSMGLAVLFVLILAYATLITSGWPVREESSSSRSDGVGAEMSDASLVRSTDRDACRWRFGSQATADQPAPAAGSVRVARMTCS